MTILGKIMTIFVFLLALAWFGLTAVVYSTRAEWKKAYTKAVEEANKNARDTEELKKQLLLERANIGARQQAADQALAALARERDELDKKYTQLLATSNQVADASANLLPALKEYDASIKKVQDQVDALSAETATLSTERDRYAAAAQLATNDKTAAELQRRVFEAALEAKTEQIRAIQDARQGGALNEADAKFRGEVTKTSERGEIIQFSGGLNAGVTRGKVYKVTRAEAPYYIGTVEVTASDGNSAAGVFTPGNVRKQIVGDYVPRVGDIVVSQ